MQYNFQDLVLKFTHSSSQLGLAEVTIDGKSVGEHDFYTAEKGVLIYYTNYLQYPDYHC